MRGDRPKGGTIRVINFHGDKVSTFGRAALPLETLFFRSDSGERGIFFRYLFPLLQLAFVVEKRKSEANAVSGII